MTHTDRVMAPYIRIHRVFVGAASALAATFAWVFVFEAFMYAGTGIVYAASHTALLYVLAQAVTILATPFCAPLIRFGVLRALVWGSMAYAAAFATLGAALTQESVSLLILFPILIGLYRAIYRAPYTLTPAEQYPRTAQILIELVPAVAGLALAHHITTPGNVLITAAELILISLVPVFVLPETYERFSWSYRQTWDALLDVRNRPLVIAATVRGVEQSALFLVWPIAIFFIVGGSYAYLGAILTLSLLVSSPIDRLLRELEHHGVRRSYRRYGVLAAAVWVVRIVAVTPVSLVVLGVFSNLGRTSLASEISRNSVFVDEFSALIEMAESAGRLALALLAAFAATLLPLGTAFGLICVIAGVASAYAIAAHTDTPSEV